MRQRLRFQIAAQPDEVTCGPTCLHGIYRYFGDELSLAEVIEGVDMLTSGGGGTLDVFLANHALERGYRVGYAEDAVVFTDAPTTFRQFYQQRKRWSRGLIEALQRHRSLLFKRRLVTLFVWWNMLFLPLDLTFTLIFIPGIVAALFGYTWIAGPLTLLITTARLSDTTGDG